MKYTSRKARGNTPPSDARSRANPEGHAGYRVPYEDDTDKSPYKPGPRGTPHKRPRRPLPKRPGRLVPPRSNAHNHPSTTRDRIGNV